ncbi:MAG: FixH family protein [Rhodospirillaceae bacterium]
MAQSNASSTAALPGAQGRTRQRGWWIPYTFVGGFLVVLAVNLTLLYFAVSTFSGLETDKAYVEGLKYNDKIAAEDAQVALGWTMNVTLAQDGAPVMVPPAAGSEQKEPVEMFPAALSIAVTDKAGQPVPGLTIEAKIQRPTQAKMDLSAVMVEDASRTYVSRVNLPSLGVWQVVLVASQGDEVVFRQRERIVLKP